MRPPTVTLRASTGTVATLAPGDFVGRMWSAGLFLDDPRISEAHALVSLRGDRLELLALRGTLSCDGMPANRVRLTVGRRVGLVDGLFVDVVDVVHPTTSLAVQGLPSGEVLLHADVHSLLPDGTLIPRFEPTATAWMWNTQDGWRFRSDGGAAQEFDPGWTDTVAGYTLALTEVQLAPPSIEDTLRHGEEPLHIVVRYDTVHMHVAEGQSLVFVGLMARLITELALVGSPVRWDVIADLLWPEERDRMALRIRWDKTVHKIRERLRRAGQRVDLIRPDGRGNFELLLLPGDRLEDQA